MFLILLIFGCAVLVACVYMAHKSVDPEIVFFSGVFFGLFPLTIFVIFTFASVSKHADDLAKVRKWDAYYQVYNRQLTDLKVHLDRMGTDVETNAKVLLNADTPVASLVNAYLKTQKKLADVESNKAAAMVSIESRRIGLFSYVVWMYGES